MKRPLIKAHFYETYYFAFCIRNILHDQFAYIRHLDDFYGDGNYLHYTAPFPRYSVFHSFLKFVIGSILTEDTEDCSLDVRQDQMVKFRDLPSALDDMKPDVLPIEHALRYHHIPHTSFTKWLAGQNKTFDQARDDDLYQYLDSLHEESAIEALLEQTVRETFYLLFGNRPLLMLFNQMMADQVAQTVVTELSADDAANFEKDGTLRRVRPPDWVKRAVFYRDRGMCCICRKDLSGILNIWTDQHFDHIVPLAEGGLNDVTNLQLLCDRCNLKKRDKDAITSSEYEDWYDMES